MPTIIMDSCSYTRLGLTDYLTSHGVKKRHINAIEDIDSLHEKCSKLNPSLVFINEDCFIHEANATERIKRVISLHRIRYSSSSWLLPMYISTIIYMFAKTLSYRQNPSNQRL